MLVAASGVEEPGYMLDPPEIEIVERKSRVLLKMPQELFFHEEEGLRGEGAKEGWLSGEM